MPPEMQWMGGEHIILPEAVGHLCRFNRFGDNACLDSTLCTLYKNDNNFLGLLTSLCWLNHTSVTLL